MKTSNREGTALSPLMRARAERKSVVARLVGALSKSRAREWIRHVKRARKDWN